MRNAYISQMIKGLPQLLITAALFAVSCTHHTFHPLTLSRRIFSKDSFPDLQRYVTGDYYGHPNGIDLPQQVTTKFRLLQQTNRKAVVVMTIIDTTGKGTDQYLYFTKDTIWKMHAIAYPTLARLEERRKQTLERMTAAEVDSSINAVHPLFASREEYDFQLNSLRLKLAQDDTIIAHFKQHKAAFDSLRDIATSNIQLVENQAPIYRKLLISNITTGSYLLENCIDFHILYDAVGYLYVKDKKQLPEMHPDKVMMLREMGDGWYLYKIAIYL